MQTEAVFENIASRIQEEIQKAQKSIYIAVAWFTNRNIFENLILKASEGCKIHLLISNDDINNNSSIDFEALQKYNGKVYKIGNGDTKLMHHKFCVIDYKTVITGSYNWSYKAETNFENITISKKNFELAKQFITEFDKTQKIHNSRQSNVITKFPVKKIIKQLKKLKSHIELNEIEYLKVVAKNLEKYNFNDDIKAILKDIKNEEFKNGVIKIELFIKLKTKKIRRQVIEIFQRNTKLFVDFFLHIFLENNNSLLTEKFVEKYNNSSCEPKILYNETAKEYYYIEQNNKKVYYHTIHSFIKDLDNNNKFYTNSAKKNMLCDILKPIYIDQISLSLAYNYFNKSKINFNNLNLKEKETPINLKKYIKEEIRSKIESSKNGTMKEKLANKMLEKSLEQIDEHVSNVEDIFKVISDIDIKNTKTTNSIKIRSSLMEDKNKLETLWFEPVIIPLDKVYQNLLPTLSLKKNKMFWYVLSSDESYLWTLKFIEKNKENFFWKRLSINKSLPLSIEFIEKYENQWDWNYLYRNESFPWSVNIIYKYAEKMNFRIPLMETLLPYIDNKIINDVFEKISDDKNLNPK